MVTLLITPLIISTHGPPSKGALQKRRVGLGFKVMEKCWLLRFSVQIGCGLWGFIRYCVGLGLEKVFFRL